MARSRNQTLHSADPAQLKKWEEEFQHYIGRDIELDLQKGQLTVLAMPKSYKKKRLAETKLRAQRKARESYEYEDDSDNRLDEE